MPSDISKVRGQNRKLVTGSSHETAKTVKGFYVKLVVFHPMGTIFKIFFRNRSIISLFLKLRKFLLGIILPNYMYYIAAG